MDALTLVTVCGAGDVADAVVLARSFRRFHPDRDVLVVVADAASTDGLIEPGVRFTTGREIAGDRFEVLAAGLSPSDLVTALGPAAVRRAARPALLLAADTEVLARVELPDSVGVLVAATGDAAEGVVDDGALGVLGDDAEAALDAMERQIEGFDVRDLLGSAAARFETVTLAREPSWAVAPWNAEERGVVLREGRLELEDATPVAWARYPREAAVGPETVYAAATAAHRAEVEAVAEEQPPLEAVCSDLPDGTPLDDRLRRHFAEAIRTQRLAHAPFDSDGLRAFQHYLDAPAEDPRAAGVSRYLYDVWLERLDLQDTYPDLRSPSDRQGFLGWAVVHGADELPIPPWLVPADWSGEAEPAEGATAVGVNVAGYFQSELGVGEAARRVVGALDAAHVPLLPVQSQAMPPSRRGHAYGVAAPATAPFPVNLVCVNADGLPAFAREVGPSFFAERHTVGMWWWELASFPERLQAAFEHVDELWVGSRFVHEAIARVAPVPVVTMPVAVPRARAHTRTRDDLGLPEGFLVLFLLDYNSVLERKNPLGLIDAFTRAFDPGEGASLVIKTSNGHLHPRDRLRLVLAAARHPHVQLIERFVSAEERDALMASCDLYASLHRSEGFGLTLAEAMALGRPTLATGWSGNLEFMRPATTTLVPYELVDVGEGNAPYDADGQWADPDLDAAATAMRGVRDDPEGATAKAASAAERLLAEHAPEVAGAAMRARLEAIAPRIADRAGAAPALTRSPGTAAALERAEARAAVGADRYASPSGGAVRRGVRSGVLKAVRPLAENQHAIDAAQLDATREVATRLHARVDAEVRAHAELTASTLAAQRRVGAQVAALTDQVVGGGDLRGDLDALRAEVDRLAALQARAEQALQPLTRGANAIPWTQGEPFASFDHDVAGRVLGFRDADGGDDHLTSYRTFEDVFRGSRERVIGLLGGYTDLLHGHAPVLDVGAGRGELLQVLRDADLEAYGVDVDEGMAAGARDHGLAITVGDGVDHLESLAAGTLGAVTAMHVIEHLTQVQLERFLAAALRALRPGGLLVCETVNPHAGFALKTFWVDPTHQHPLFPETSLVLARAAGFPSAFVCHLRGVRDVELDRFNEDSYTLVAQAPAP